MNYKMKNLFQNLLVFVISALSAFIILELAIRIVKSEYTFENRAEQNITLLKSAYPCQYDPYLGWIPKEGYSGNKNTWGTTVTILKNGVRSNGSETTIGTTGPVSILAVGDSFTFGDGVSDSDTWPAFLEKMSKKRVINGGVFGYGIDQIFLRADALIKIYNPDILILSFFVDDIYRCGLSKRTGVAKPYFEAGNNGLILKNVPVPAPSRKIYCIYLFRKIFGYSVLIDYIMKSAFPDYWLQDRWESAGVHSRGEAEQRAYLLFQHLRDIIQANTLKRIFILVQYPYQTRPEEIASIDMVISGINDKSIEVVDLRHSFDQLMRQDKKRWDRCFNGHMTPEGNYFVACELQRILNETDLH